MSFKPPWGFFLRKDRKMYGLTEFNIFEERDGWYIHLVDGENDSIVLRGVKRYKTRNSAYRSANALWERLFENAEVNLLPVRYAG